MDSLPQTFDFSDNLCILLAMSVHREEGDMSTTEMEDRLQVQVAEIAASLTAMIISLTADALGIDGARGQIVAALEKALARPVLDVSARATLPGLVEKLQAPSIEEMASSSDEFVSDILQAIHQVTQNPKMIQAMRTAIKPIAERSEAATKLGSYVPRTPHICEVCLKSFTAYERARYCSTACRNAAYRKRKKLAQAAKEDTAA